MSIEEVAAREIAQLMEEARAKDVDLHNLRTAFEVGMKITEDQGRVISEKDAEIARLKAKNDKWVKESYKTMVEIERLKGEFQKAREWNKLTEIQVRNLQEIVENQDQLITELVDALEDCGTKPYLDLKTRAWEATQ